MVLAAPGPLLTPPRIPTLLVRDHEVEVEAHGSRSAICLQLPQGAHQQSQGWRGHQRTSSCSSGYVAMHHFDGFLEAQASLKPQDMGAGEGKGVERKLVAPVRGRNSASFHACVLLEFRRHGAVFPLQCLSL